MSSTQHRSETHNGHRIEATATQDGHDGQWRSQLSVRTAAGTQLPYGKDDATTYDTAEQALSAAVVIGRGLADERPDLPEDA
ncbi:hypothetical protein [Pseudoxanthomonas composti]|jgi:hypothetical protein|uniref:Uncharacterized protein n=1 Tax=Pseudoxanthomonas composti TaxID=2137479 RepID=A0A4Q1JRY5_9GAMM|nr:hypothetical protein [Pseudoxanthomonas composti]RXQ99928.1 hypothetical protein EPA99_17550 [Pseudoxanthomonas composti]